MHTELKKGEEKEEKVQAVIYQAVYRVNSNARVQ